MAEPFLARLKYDIKVWLEHLRYRDIVVDGEIARWYPDHAGGSLHHEDWWALVNSDQIPGLAARFASDKPNFHICKHKKWSAAAKRTFVADMRWNPLSMDADISIPCGICCSYSCCRPGPHGITALAEAMLRVGQ
jgi:hypothetical protein